MADSCQTTDMRDDPGSQLWLCLCVVTHVTCMVVCVPAFMSAETIQSAASACVWVCVGDCICISFASTPDKPVIHSPARSSVSCSCQQSGGVWVQRCNLAEPLRVSSGFQVNHRLWMILSCLHMSELSSFPSDSGSWKDAICQSHASNVFVGSLKAGLKMVLNSKQTTRNHEIIQAALIVFRCVMTVILFFLVLVFASPTVGGKKNLVAPQQINASICSQAIC